MRTHIARVRERRIIWDDRRVVRHGMNSDEVRLDLDGEWGRCDRVQAVMSNGGEPVRLLVEGDRLTIPSALMAETGALRTCVIGYVGDSVRIVTEREALPLSVVESGEVAGLDPAPERPDLWARLMAEVERASRSAAEAAESAGRCAEVAEAVSGNVLRGVATGAVAHMGDALPSRMLGLTVFGRSEQVTTAGKNLFDWDLYTGGKPSPSPEYPQPITSVTACDVTAAGRNLADPSSFEGVGWAVSVPEYVELFNQMMGMTFTLSVEMTLKSIAVPGEMYRSYSKLLAIGEDGSGYAVLSNTVWGADAKVGDKRAKSAIVRLDGTHGAVMSVWLYGSGVDGIGATGTADIDVMFEPGGSATPYEPYRGTSTPIDLQGHELRSLPNGVRDEVRVEGGEAVLVRRVAEAELDGTEGWQPYSHGFVFCEGVFSEAADTSDGLGIRSDRLYPLVGKYDVVDAPHMDGACYLYKSDVTTWFYVESSEPMGEFRAGLAENPARVLYELAEPQEIPLGRVDLPALPSTVSNVWADTDVPTEVSVGYIRDVNVVVGRLEEAVGLMASMMDEPTTIPEV